MKKLIFIFGIFTALVGQTHEGHDKTPGALSAPHGGLLKGTDHIYLELVTSGDVVNIYPLDHDMKAVPIADVKIEGTAKFPRKGKTEAVKLNVVKDHFEAKVAAKGVNRYDLELAVTHSGKTEKIKFSVEPQ